ncbi:nitrite transporter [Pseudomonas sp. ATCC PTA-122608]|uniref:nitrite transporter n=1 Tax=Pseudomonas sp. ATCC PTA-122608 TaxID=1771311 RepID=UPI00096B6AB5|nr:nitrite transporter [Pseudomonas sp. ATCC PTA-122608]OLY75587.1 nitrite transporter [Pseudomonas sp. ATCC PTA-122608]
MIDHDKYPSGKYREGGRVWPFVDCYGLVLEVRRDLGLPDWPEWAFIRAGDGSMVEVAGKWFPTLTPCEPEEGALIALYEGSEMRHVGVVVRVDASLEAMEITEKHNVICLPLHRLKRRFVRVEYYK